MKLLIWVLIIALIVIWLIRKKGAAIKGDVQGTQDRQDRQDSDQRKQVEPIVRCTHCGVHVPASEALGSPTGAVFCSEEHRLKHARY